MQPTHRTMTPPGVILLEDLMTPLNMTPQALAAALDLPESVVVAIIRGDEPVTADVHRG
jgi:plasmid maintenance system antidote protein VapI